MCGCCPYFEKCVFLHDHRVRVQSSHRSFVLCRATPQCHAVKDAFYWPDMSLLKVMEKRDRYHLPTANQEYNFNLVSANRASTKATMHDIAVFSMWKHFVLYLETSDDETAEDNVTTNRFTGLPRLSVLIELSQRQDKIERRELSLFNQNLQKISALPTALHDKTNCLEMYEDYRFWTSF